MKSLDAKHFTGCMTNSFNFTQVKELNVPDFYQIDQF